MARNVFETTRYITCIKCLIELQPQEVYVLYVNIINMPLQTDARSLYMCKIE